MQVCGWNPSVIIQMKAIEQYFHVVLFIMLYMIIQMKAIEQYFHVIMLCHYYYYVHGTVYYMLYKVVAKCKVCGWNPNVWSFNYQMQTIY